MSFDLSDGDQISPSTPLLRFLSSPAPAKRPAVILIPAVIICNDDDESVPESAKVIRVPKTVDCLQGLINVLPLQLLSYRESRLSYPSTLDLGTDKGKTWP